MSRRAYSFSGTPQNRQTGHEYDSYAPNNAISNRTLPQISRSASLQRTPDYYAGDIGYRRRQLYEDMIPLGYAGVPTRPPVRVLVVRRGMEGGVLPRPRELTRAWPPQAYANQQDMQVRTSEEGSRLSQDEQNNVLNKLKREIYNPTARRLARTVSLYYRDPESSGNTSKNVNDEDVKNCAICLEDFEPKEEVTVTPCKHMFHQECIVPWIKSQGKCPVCRFALSESVGADTNRYTTRDVAAPAPNDSRNDLLPGEVLSIIRAMDMAFPWD